MAEATTALVRRKRERLADLPWPPLAALLPLIPTRGPRSYLAIQPLGGGQLVLEVGGGALAAAVVLEGDATRPLHLPRAAIGTLATRHPHGERLAIDGPAEVGDPLLRLAVLDSSSSATLLSAEAVPVEGPSISALVGSQALLPAGDQRRPLLDPKLLGIAVAAMARLAGGPFSLGIADHPLLGALLRADIPEEGAEGVLLAATIAVARCIRPSEAQG